MDSASKSPQGFISPDGTDKIELSEFKIFRKLGDIRPAPEPEESGDIPAPPEEEDDGLEAARMFEVFMRKPEPEPEPEEVAAEPEPEVSSAELLGEVRSMEQQVLSRKRELRSAPKVIYDPYNEKFNANKGFDGEDVPEMPSGAGYEFKNTGRK